MSGEQVPVLAFASGLCGLALNRLHLGTLHPVAANPLIFVSNQQGMHAQVLSSHEVMA